MSSIFLSIFSGVLVGYLIRKRTFIKHVGSIISLIIVFLLFFLGVAVGVNKQIIENFANIGLDAFAIAVGTSTGSVLCAWFVYNRFFKQKKTSQ
ncbi:MAG: LysO family transporter [Dysgonamonadaceae bacterium]|nr:LysO family transporter [Dysgonamonadaceae bacterium]MDD4727995.1 LysO family transporter [Dysgonamonadaceae bacterium]